MEDGFRTLSRRAKELTSVLFDLIDFYYVNIQARSELCQSSNALAINLRSDRASHYGFPVNRDHYAGARSQFFKSAFKWQEQRQKMFQMLVDIRYRYPRSGIIAPQRIIPRAFQPCRRKAGWLVCEVRMSGLDPQNRGEFMRFSVRTQ